MNYLTNQEMAIQENAQKLQMAHLFELFFQMDPLQKLQDLFHQFPMKAQSLQC